MATGLEERERFVFFKNSLKLCRGYNHLASFNVNYPASSP